MHQETEMQATSIVSLFQTDKSQQNSFIANVIENVENGTVDVIQVHASLKKMEYIVNAINDNPIYKDCLLDGAQKNGKNFKSFDAEWAVKELGTKYDFTLCGDNELLSLQDQAADLALKIKERQDFLKKIKPEGLEIVDKETGEAITYYPPSRTSTTGVVVTLK